MMRQTNTPIMVKLFSTLLIFLLFTSSSFSILSEARPRIINPHHIRFFNVTPNQATRRCSYTVTIKTSCSSPSYTTDEISLTFGDTYDNQVHIPRLDDPLSGMFARCSTDTFQIEGSCPDEIPVVYLMRSGSDGWKPESLKIQGPNANTIIFLRFDPMDLGLDLVGVSRCSSPPPEVCKEGQLWYSKNMKKKKMSA